MKGKAALVPGRLPFPAKNSRIFITQRGCLAQVLSIATTLNPFRKAPTVSVVAIGRTN